MYSTFFPLVLVCCLFLHFSSQVDVSYYINCPQQDSFSSFAQAATKCASDGFDLHTLYVCGNVPITDSINLNFKVKFVGVSTEDFENTRNNQNKFAFDLKVAQNVDDQWTKEAQQKLNAMVTLSNQIHAQAVAQLTLSQGVNVEFVSTAQFLTIAVLPEDTTTSFTLTFDQTTDVSNSVIGTTDVAATPKIIVSKGTSFKISDSFVAVDEFSVTSKSVAIAKSIVTLGSSSTSLTPFMFSLQDSTDFNSNYFTSSTSESVIVAGNKSIKLNSNNWFNSAILYRGPMAKIQSTGEFGYIF